MAKKKSRALSIKDTEIIRGDVELDLGDLMGDLISAMKATHSVMRVGTMNLKYVAALSPELDAIANELRQASEKFRKIQAGVETLAHRSKQGKL